MTEHEQEQVSEQQANLYHGPAPRFTVGDVLSDESIVHSIGWHVPRQQWWVTTRLADGTPDSGGIEPFFANRTIVIRAADNPLMATPENPPQLGDRVRLTMKREQVGRVDKTIGTGKLHVNGFYLDVSGRTVEILERAQPKFSLPNEDGYYLGHDKMMKGPILTVVYGGKMCIPDANKAGGIGQVLGSPERFVPFQKLIIDTTTTTNTEKEI